MSDAEQALIITGDGGDTYAIPVEALESFKVPSDDDEVSGFGQATPIWMQNIQASWGPNTGGSLSNYKPPTRPTRTTTPTP